jgi:hypothetical protein
LLLADLDKLISVIFSKQHGASAAESYKPGGALAVHRWWLPVHRLPAIYIEAVLHRWWLLRSMSVRTIANY